MSCSNPNQEHRPCAPEWRWHGLLLGTAIGDSVGLPAEGLRAARLAKWYRHGWGHRLLGPWGGMASDDTEHTVFTANCLLARNTGVASNTGVRAHHTAPDRDAAQEVTQRFLHCLAWELRLWLLGLPAGIGFATLRAILRLWLGVSPERSGVFSAGNGPAMRAAPIGLFYAHDTAQRWATLHASTQLTHTDPKALIAARAVADIAAWIGREQPSATLEGRPAWPQLRAWLEQPGDDPASQCVAWRAALDTCSRAVAENWQVIELSRKLHPHGQPEISGYIYHTVPVAIYAWHRHWGDPSATLTAVWQCGGDTDTAGAVAGALVGALAGTKPFPTPWVTGYRDWPLSQGFLQRLATALSTPQCRPVYYCRLAVPVRNLFFLVLVLIHGARRLLPPY